MKEFSVLLVDNNLLLTQLLTRFFQCEEYARVMQTSSKILCTAQFMLDIHPDVVLIDLDTSIEESMESIRKLRAARMNGLIIAFSGQDGLPFHAAVIRAGADCLYPKTDLNANFLIGLHHHISLSSQTHLRRPKPKTEQIIHPSA